MMRCAACGEPVTDSERFCGSCGAALDAARPAEARRDTQRAARRLFTWGGGAVVAAIVAASVVWRGAGPAEPFADPATQRAAVERVHSLVVDGRWSELTDHVAEPPSSFVDVMEQQERSADRVVDVEIEGMRLRRSRSVPLLEVSERVQTSAGAVERVRSFYAWKDGRWLFAFTAPAG